MDKKINILFLIDYLKGGAGTERHLAEVVRRLNKDKFRCFICAFDGGTGKLVESIEKQGTPVRNIQVDKFYTLNALRQALHLRKFIRENKIDIVQTFHFKSDTYGVLVSRLSGVRAIISSRRDTGDLKGSRHILLNRICNPFVSRYIMVCDAVGKTVCEKEGVPQDKMITIHNGVDLSRFRLDGDLRLYDRKKALGIGENAFVVGTVAIFRPEKSYDVFFDGIEKIRRSVKNLKVLVLGTGPLKEHFENRCKSNGLNEVVTFMGYVPDVEKYLPLMDVFCLVPGKNEGFSNAVLEAMAMGRPVIATNVGGNAEAVVDGETGFIIPPGNSDALSHALLKLYQNKVLCKSMGNKGRERIEKNFTIEKMIRTMEELYAGVTEGR